MLRRYSSREVAIKARVHSPMAEWERLERAEKVSVLSAPYCLRW